MSPRVAPIQAPLVAPMLATAGSMPSGADWAFEFKWDGVRAIVLTESGRVSIFARSGAEITAAYPELAGLADQLASAGVAQACLDGEIVALVAGRPSFEALAQRIHVRDEVRARLLAAAQPVTLMLFDVLSLNGIGSTPLPYTARRELLESILPSATESGGPWLISPRFTDGQTTVAVAREHGLEGVMAKRLSSRYRPGLRSPDWVKLKFEQTADLVIGGWRPGRRRLGALLVGSANSDGTLRYRGRVGGGISVAAEQALLAALAPLSRSEAPFLPPPPAVDRAGAHWVEPAIVVEVRFGALTADGRLRFPSFLRLRPDKPASSAVLVDAPYSTEELADEGGR